MLYSYLISPTHTTHPLPDVVARFSARALPPPGDELLPASANAIRALAPVLKEDVAALGAAQVYRDIDLPLVPVLLRMEEAGVRMTVRFSGQWGRAGCGDAPSQRANLRGLRPSLQHQFT